MLMVFSSTMNPRDGMAVRRVSQKAVLKHSKKKKMIAYQLC
jgi:hypothetical protein